MAGHFFGGMLISARSLAEYRAMFALSDEELSCGTILDCPAGAASFAAEARQAGALVVCADPAYRADLASLLAAGRDSVRRAGRYSIDHPDKFVWGWFASTEHHRQVRHDACERFAAEYSVDRSRYLAAALPALPFPDRSFALTLSSHLLFCWSDRFDYAFHRAALMELVRVTEGEVRVFPLIDPAAVRYPYLNRLAADLESAGIAVEIRRVGYVVQVGGGELLVAFRSR